MNSLMRKGIVVGLLLILPGVRVLAQTTSDLPLDLVRAWSSDHITVRGLGSEIARLESTPPVSLIIVAAKIARPFRIERTTAVRTREDRCCAGLSVVLDDSRRINSWEVRLLTTGGRRVDPAAFVVLDRMAYLGGRTLVAGSVETDANLADVFASAGDAPKVLFVYKLEGSSTKLKWQVRDSKPKALQLQPRQGPDSQALPQQARTGPRDAGTFRVRGIVVAEDGVPVRSKTIHAYPVGNSGEPIVFYLFDDKGHANTFGFYAKTDEQGAFSVEIPHEVSVEHENVNSWQFALQLMGFHGNQEK